MEAGRRHLVVIGAGIVGTCCVLALLRDGHRVTLLDRGGPGEGTSFGNAAVLSPHGILPTARPGVLRKVPGYLTDPLGPLAIRWRYLPQLAPWLTRFVLNARPDKVERSTRAMHALIDPVVEVYRDLVQWAGAEDMIRPQGWLAVVESEAVWRGYQANVAIYRRFGADVTLLGPDEIRQYEPSLRGRFAGAALYPRVAHVVNNFRFVQVLAQRALALGATWASDEAVGFDFRDGRVIAVRGRDKLHACDGVVLAGGAWSKGLARALGARVALDTERGYHIQVPAPGFELRRPILSVDGGFVATSLETGLRVAGTDELGGLKLPPNWERAEVIRRKVKGWFPDLNDQGYSRWMGFRPSTPDSLPVISASPRIPNAWLAFGHGHLGLTLGARTGQMIAALVGGRTPEIDLNPFRADRF